MEKLESTSLPPSTTETLLLYGIEAEDESEAKDLMRGIFATDMKAQKEILFPEESGKVNFKFSPTQDERVEQESNTPAQSNIQKNRK